MNQIRTRTALVTSIKENFIRMTMLEDAILDLNDMIENHTAENKIVHEKKHVILIDTRLNSMSSDEAVSFLQVMSQQNTDMPWPFYLKVFLAE